MILALSMPELAPLVTDAQVASLDAGMKPRPAGAGTLPAAGTLVARCYGRRDWVLRRLLAVNDAVCLALAMMLATALAGGQHGHSWREYLLYGLVTLPAWVVLFKMYGLYERDAKPAVVCSRSGWSVATSTRSSRSRSRAWVVWRTWTCPS
jgi:MFS family permease